MNNKWQEVLPESQHGVVSGQQAELLQRAARPAGAHARRRVRPALARAARPVPLVPRTVVICTFKHNSQCVYDAKLTKLFLSILYNVV